MDEDGLRIVAGGEEVLLEGGVPAFSFHKFVPEKIGLTISNSWTDLFEVTLRLLKYSHFVVITIFGEQFCYSNPISALYVFVYWYFKKIKDDVVHCFQRQERLEFHTEHVACFFSPVSLRKCFKSILLSWELRRVQFEDKLCIGQVFLVFTILGVAVSIRRFTISL
jgi:hypothetical protein